MSVKREPNPDRPATAISFDKETLDAIKEIAKSEERSLAAQVRIVVEAWLQSPEGIAALRKSKKKPLDLTTLDLQPRQDLPPSNEGRERVLSELRDLLAQYPSTPPKKGGK